MLRFPKTKKLFMDQIKLAIIGTGGMAHTHANAFAAIKEVNLVACCDVVRERAEEFAATHSIPFVFTDVDEMLSTIELHAITNVTPDRFHLSIGLKVLDKKLHLLSEKPLAETFQDARMLADAAEQAGVVHMVNLSYRRSAALYEAKRMIEAGKIGRVMHFEADYLQSWLAQPAWGDWREHDAWLWRLSTDHGSKGVLGDIGVHIFDLAGFPIGAYETVQCVLKTFPKAENDQIGTYKLDANDSFTAMVEMENGALGTVQASRWATGYINTLRLQIHGEHGALRLTLDEKDRWDVLEVCLGDNLLKGKWRGKKCPPVLDNYQRFISAILNGQPGEPDFWRGAEIQKVLDAAYMSDYKQSWEQL
ncbi:MAG: Gfo/Idh/MocA family oxidoreductase [Bacteroidetes Order II. Incertae sedis bacterium]|nr:Gfo/Idh/MocA family oxidoreductase [Bacteroidetes Order II. bacterium]